MTNDDITHADLLAINPAWTDGDREMLRRVLALVAKRAGKAYKRQSYWALERANGHPRIPLYIGTQSVSIDSEIELPPDLESRAYPESLSHHNSQYLKIEFSTKRR